MTKHDEKIIRLLHQRLSGTTEKSTEDLVGDHQRGLRISMQTPRLWPTTLEPGWRERARGRPTVTRMIAASVPVCECDCRHDFPLSHHRFHLARRRAAFSVRRPNHGNKLPLEVVTAPTVEEFKKQSDSTVVSIFLHFPKT